MPIKNLFRYWTFQVFSPGTVLREKYEAFKRLLDYDKQAHDHLAILEALYYNKERKDFQAVVKTYREFAGSVSGMVDELLAMCPSRYWSLKDYFKKFDFYVRFMLAPPEFDFSPPFTIDTDKAGVPDETAAGKKAAVLARLNRKLHLPVPRGFVITTNAFQFFLEANDLRDPINHQLAGLDIHNRPLLKKTADRIRKMIIESPVPVEVESEILSALKHLEQKAGQTGSKHLRLALRSSAVKEDGTASFAGQYLSLMNIKKKHVLKAYKEVLAGKYSRSALFYRISTGIADHDTPMAVLVLEMKKAQSAGVMYTRQMDGPDSDQIMIHSVWGQGGLLVEGKVSPDRIRVDKTTGAIETLSGAKKQQMGLDRDTGTRIVETDPDKQDRLSLDRSDILTLARWGKAIEIYFNSPQDIEWCKDGSGRLFLLQSRPLKPLSKVPSGGPQAARLTEPAASPLGEGGETICPGIATGPVFRLDRLNQLKDIPEGAIVLAAYAQPHFVTAAHKMAGIIIRTGSAAGHFSSIAREFGIPAMVAKGTDGLDPGRIITLDTGNCRIYDGVRPIENGAPQEDMFSDSNFLAKLEFTIKFCAELRLTDPSAPSFTPEGCRSHHDIIRFAHETAMKEMFLLGERKGSRKKGARQLNSKLPLLFYVLDAGKGRDGGIAPDAAHKSLIACEDIRSRPMRAILKGLSHPDICWEETRHFDWESYDKTVMAGGIISPDNPQFGSYAVVARDYANINLRFGYHFVIIDTICSPSTEDNYISFRFSGGGGPPEGRWLRAGFIAGVLERLDFMVDLKSDLIDARTSGAGKKAVETRLEMLGRLMGATKLMDMYLKDTAMLDGQIEDFMNGRYDFRPGGPGKTGNQ